MRTVQSTGPVRDLELTEVATLKEASTTVFEYLRKKSSLLIVELQFQNEAY